MDAYTIYAPAANAAAPSTAVGELDVNLNPLEYLVLDLPIEHIAQFLSNVSVGFLAIRQLIDATAYPPPIWASGHNMKQWLN